MAAEAVPAVLAPPQAMVGDPAATSAVLPRVRSAQPESEPSAPAEPTVTVTIGRIEVLPPAQPPAAPRPGGHRKAPGAPDLGDYLRGRSGR